MVVPEVSPPPAEPGERLPLIFFGILLVELLTMAALLWMGQHFGS